MTQVLASGKTAENKYDLRNNNPNKVFPRLDARILAEDFKYFYEVAKGYSQSGNEGSSEAINQFLSTINLTNINSYSKEFTKGLNTLISFANYLEVASNSTANAIILNSTKIQDIISPDNTNYCQQNPLPYNFRDNLTFRFKATLSNTGSVSISIPELSGLNGSTPLISEDGNELVAGDIEINKYYTIVATGSSTTKKFLLIKRPKPASFSIQGLTYLKNPITIGNH